MVRTSITVSEAGKIQIAEIALDIIRRSTLQGINAEGVIKPNWDWRDTGKLMQLVNNVNGDLVFSVDYAKHVYNANPWGIPPQFMDEYVARVNAVLETEIVFEITEE